MSSAIEFDITGFLRGLDATKAEVLSAAVTGVHDSLDNLIYISRNEAPLETGTLRATAGKTVEVVGDEVIGEAYYSVTEQTKSRARGEGSTVRGTEDRFNYALRLHEMGSYKNPNIANTRPKFLERPLKVNAKRYRRMIADAIKEALM